MAPRQNELQYYLLKLREVVNHAVDDTSRTWNAQQFADFGWWVRLQPLLR